MKKFLRIIAICLVIGLCSENCEGASAFYRNLTRRFSSRRENYSHLSDTEFANFREVRTTGIAKGKLYRSYSPVRGNSRGLIALKASQEASIKTFINLSDSDKVLRDQKVFRDSYYAQQKFIALNMRMNFQHRNFQARLAKAIKFMAANEAPYLVHCILGKDRTGFVCAILECLTGAELDEIVDDYLVSFKNYFGILPGSKDYDFIANNEIRAFLMRAFGVKSLESVNLAKSAENYLLKIGVYKPEIETLQNKLNPLP